MPPRRGGLPAPELVRGASTPFGNVVLLTWPPGTNLLEVLSRDPAATRHWGRRMGELQRRLHEIAAPPPVVRVSADDERPFRAGRDTVGLPSGDRLLHLDWHPLNLLVDEGSGTVTGIVDWDNARAGDPRLDLARTRGILTLEPELASLPPLLRAELGTLLDAWADGYGREARDLPSACERWATRVMIADLEPRYAARPDALEPLRSRLAELQANAS